jgi:hypothetical protein
MTFLVTVFVVLESVTVAQTTAAPSAFSLGATMEDTYRVFGVPSQWFACQWRITNWAEFRLHYSPIAGRNKTLHHLEIAS